MDEAEIKHNNICDIIEMELRSRGHENIHKHIEYKHLYKMPGEIDLLCIDSDKYVLLFEIKGHYTRHGHNKAIKQLDHGEKWINSVYYKRNTKIFKFFVYQENEEIIYNWVRHKEMRR